MIVMRVGARRGEVGKATEDLWTGGFLGGWSRAAGREHFDELEGEDLPSVCDGPSRRPHSEAFAG